MSDEYNSLIYNSKLDKTTRNLKEATHDPTKTTKVRQKKTIRKRHYYLIETGVDQRKETNTTNTTLDQTRTTVDQTNTTPDQTKTLIISIIRQKQHLN